VSLRFEGYLQTHMLSFDKIKAVELPLTPVDFEDEQSVNVTAVLSFVEGSKVVTIRSPVLVENKCPTAVLFRVQRGQSTLFSSAPLAPNAQFGIPPVLLQGRSNATLSVQVVAEDSRSWALLPVELSRLPHSTRVIPIKNDTHCLNACIIDTTVQQLRIPSHTIALYPPLLLENALPEAAKFELIVAGKPVFQGMLDSGEKTAVYRVEHQQPADMLFTIPGFICTHPVAVTAEPSLARAKLQRDKDKPLGIDVEVSIAEGGSRKVLVFSKYWIVNATGLQVFFFSVINGRKTAIPAHRPVATLADLPHLSRDDSVPWDPRDKWRVSPPILFSPDEQGPEAAQTSLAFKLSGSKLSEAFDIDSFGVPREIIVVEEKHPTQELRHRFSFGVSIGFGSGRFSRTKIVTVSPRIVLYNKCAREIYYKQVGLGINYMFTLPPATALPYHWPNKDGAMLISVSLAPTSEFGCWSGGFAISDIGRLCVRVPSAAQDTCEFLWVDVAAKAASIVVSFSPCPRNKTAYRIDNASSFPVVIMQQSVGTPATVSPGSSMPFAWDEPTRPKRKLVVTVLAPTAPFEFPKPISLDKIGSTAVVTIDTACAVRATLRLDGAVKVLHIEGCSVSAATADVPPPATSPIVQDTVQRPAEMPVVGFRFTFVVTLHGIGVSVVNATPRELVYATLDGIYFKYQTNDAEESYAFMLEGAQIDNQLHITPYPVMLTSADKSRQTRMLTVVALKSKQFTDVHYFKYLAALISEFNLSVDEALLLVFPLLPPPLPYLHRCSQ